MTSNNPQRRIMRLEHMLEDMAILMNDLIALHGEDRVRKEKMLKDARRMIAERKEGDNDL